MNTFCFDAPAMYLAHSKWKFNLTINCIIFSPCVWSWRMRYNSLEQRKTAWLCSAPYNHCNDPSGVFYCTVYIQKPWDSVISRVKSVEINCGGVIYPCSTVFSPLGHWSTGASVDAISNVSAVKEFTCKWNALSFIACRQPTWIMFPYVCLPIIFKHLKRSVISKSYLCILFSLIFYYLAFSYLLLTLKDYLCSQKEPWFKSLVLVRRVVSSHHMQQFVNAPKPHHDTCAAVKMATLLAHD